MQSLFVIPQCHILFEGMYLMKMVNEACLKSELRFRCSSRIS